MRIIKATDLYEAWLGERLTIVQEDLDKKRLDMASDPFIFLRATCYRWAQLCPQVCRGPAAGPVVLAVGDLHIENFGTWRDIEGRLIWGVNDFDEAYPLPYTNDLIRLATSANFALTSNHLEISLPDACNAILKGYIRALGAGGKPFVLAEENLALRAMATANLRDPIQYWRKLDAQKTVRGPIPASAADA